jgi:hypothetical protein
MNGHVTASRRSRATGNGGSARSASVAPPPLKDTNYPAPANAIYVSTIGNDSAAGTLTAPLRTVNAAVAKLPAGGTVVPRAETFRESVNPVNKPITLQPYPHEMVWLKGSDVLTSWVADGAAWRASGWPDGGHVLRRSGDGTAGGPPLLVDDCSLSVN